MVTIIHNPRCSKSRQTLALLQQNNIDAEIVEYLKNPLTKDQIVDILKKLNISARELLRTSESEYKEFNLADKSLSEQEIITAMVEHPKLIQRPIVINDQKAAIGRPPETVLEIM